jgi:hypothetical protein
MKLNDLFPPQAGEQPYRDWVWCLHCERVYPRQQWEDGNLSCPTPGCDAEPIDAWPWESLREHHPEYPEVPGPGAHYPWY